MVDPKNLQEASVKVVKSFGFGLVAAALGAFILGPGTALMSGLIGGGSTLALSVKPSK